MRKITFIFILAIWSLHLSANDNTVNDGASNKENGVMACSSPRGLTSTNVDINSVTLTWYSVEGAQNYFVEYKPSFSSYWNVLPGSTKNYYNLSGLTRNTTYNWRVKTDCSDYSNGFNFTTTTGCNAPGGLTSSSIETNSAYVVWNPVSGAQNYTVEYKIASSSSWTVIPSITERYYQLTGLKNGTTYSWRVKADCSDYTTGFDFTTIACAAPVGLTSTNITGSSATVVWADIAGVESYTVQYKPSSATTWTTINSVTDSYYHLTGLLSNTTYNWRVKAVCSASDDSPYTNGTNFKTTAPCGVPASLSALNITSNSVYFTWVGVSGAQDYTIEYKTRDDLNWTIVRTTANNYNLTGLIPSTRYYWRVKTNCSDYDSSVYINGSDFTTLVGCNTPGGLTSSSIEANSAYVVWNPVSGAQSYTVEYKPLSSSTWTVVSSITDRFYHLTGLLSGTKYNWKVRADCSAYAIGYDFTTTTACNAPGGLTTSGIEENSAYVVWAPVSGAQSYTVEYKPLSSSTWITIPQITENYYHLTGLISNTTYQWAVKAVCSDSDNSAFTAGYNFTTLGKKALKSNVEDIKAGEIDIYPNPATSMFTLRANVVIKNLTLISLSSGIVALSDKKAENEKAYYIGNLPKGTYILRAETENGTISKRIIIK